VSLRKLELSRIPTSWIVTIIVAIALIRVAYSYRSTAQAFDEPCHVAAAMELLDRHSYTLDPVHPPLSRIAIGLPLYLAGKRYPVLTGEEATNPNYNVVGNHILYDEGDYMGNLALARSAMLPFLIGTSLLVFFWSRREFGNLAGFVSLLLVTSTPIVLALSSIAYTDMVAATTQLASLFAFAIWVAHPTVRRSFILGGAIGLALLSKMTAVIFLPAAAAGIMACKWILERQSIRQTWAAYWKQFGLAFGVSIIVLWSGYGFSVGHIREEMGISLATMPSFQHFPGLMGRLAKSVLLRDPLIPAPALFRGFATAWVLNKSAPAAYLFGQIRPGGWWYFFPVGLFFKAPLPLFCLSGLGFVAAMRFIRTKQISGLAPAISVIMILIVTMGVKYNAGIRHVLVIFPLLAVVAGAGASYLWNLFPNVRVQSWARVALAILIAWQGVETVRSQSDFISYFNELAGQDPSRIMVAGCDLDCGQDMIRLSSELARRDISNLSLAVWSSADLSRMNLPDFHVLQPFTPATGWVAISARSRRFGDVLHNTYPPGAFAWLNGYQPVAEIGHTIWLYNIPEQTHSDSPTISEKRRNSR
jgi:Dolichyl-phosphate-mannose-protein mannosyltransferase